jgi:hypothetical protein
MAVTLEDKLRPRHIPIYYTYKRIKWDQFFVGFFGALAIFGVLMKLWQPPFWGLVTPETGQMLFEIFMPIGFLGECIVFIIMGFVKGDDYEEVYPSQDQLSMLAKEDHSPFSNVQVQLELSDAIRDLVERRLDKELDTKVKEIVQILAGQATSTIELNNEVQRVQQNLLQMGNNVFEFSEKMVDLRENMSNLNNLKEIDITSKIEALNSNLSHANESIQALDDQIKRASAKFESFNR